jgi:hypothetical protein
MEDSSTLAQKSFATASFFDHIPKILVNIKSSYISFLIFKSLGLLKENSEN